MRGELVPGCLIRFRLVPAATGDTEAGPQLSPRKVDHSWAAGTLVFLTPGCSRTWCPGRVREVPAQAARGPEVCVMQVIRNKLLIWGRFLNAFFQHFYPPFSLQSAPSPRGPSALRTPGPVCLLPGLDGEQAAPGPATALWPVD